jgi:hypothetical protein
MTSRLRVSRFGLSLLGALTLAACGDDGASSSAAGTGGEAPSTSTGASGGQGSGGASGCGLVVSEAYDGADFETNAADILALRAQLDALNAELKKPELDLAYVPELTSLTALYEAGTPSLADENTADHDGLVRGWLSDVVAAAGEAWTPVDPPVGDGGVLGEYLFNAEGIDLRQAIEKGSFAAIFYRHARANFANPDAAQLDALLAAYGAHPSFPGDSETTDPALVPHPDRLAAQYAERRSPKDPSDASKPLDAENPGPYFRVKRHFLVAQAAIAKGTACDAERDAAVAAIFDEWERSLAATSIYYFKSAATQLTTEPQTPELVSKGLHGFNEGVAFVRGFRGVNEDERLITNAELEPLLASVFVPVEGPASAYTLATDAAGSLPALLSAVDTIAQVYGFTPSEVAEFSVSH